MGHFRHVCLGTGDPVCHGLACTQQNMQPCSLLGTCCFMASTVEMQDWCMCGIGCPVRVQVPGARVSPQGAPLQVLCIAQPGYYCLAITASTINY